MEITAKLVNQLRERSGAPLMDCKRALVACNTPNSTEKDLLEAAFDYLRKAGLKAADKRAGRATGQGRVAVEIAPDGRAGAMVALGCETDFVAATDDFIGLVEAITEFVLLKNPDTLESLSDGAIGGGKTRIGDALKEFVSKSGENTQITSMVRLENPAGRVGAYVHHNQKIGALISLTTTAPAAAADAFLKQLGMHIASSKPVAMSRAEIPADVIEREKAVYRESDELKDKPADRIEKILQGKLEKFFQGAALLDQPWVHDDKQTVKQAVEKALGAGSRIERFALVQVGA